MAALVTCTSRLSYNSDSCVAPSTTRWLLLEDVRVASLSCRLSQLGSDAPAVTTASGLFPRLPSLRVWVGARNSSTLVVNCRVEGVSASICARCWGGNSGTPDRARTTSGQSRAEPAGKPLAAPAGNPRRIAAFVVRSYPVLPVAG